VLGRLDVKHKVYVHINNTNPMLMEGSSEQAAVLAAGCRVGRDGMEFAI
jgi:pyrroloquinoline quinone biosynthesis protein B